MTAIRPGLPPLPERLQGLPISDRGYPVPAFVHWQDGQPDFRVIRIGWLKQCVQFDKCWMCGGRLGRHRAYVVGPMCCVTRTSAEPPSHNECATYAATACPFLTNPGQRRRPEGMPEGSRDLPGVAIPRNPGVAVVWVTHGPTRTFRAPNGMLLHIGEPSEVRWYAEGRPATRSEVQASLVDGMPALVRMTDADADPSASKRDLDLAFLAVQKWLPPPDVVPQASTVVARPTL